MWDRYLDQLQFRRTGPRAKFGSGRTGKQTPEGFGRVTRQAETLGQLAKGRFDSVAPGSDWAAHCGAQLATLGAPRGYEHLEEGGPPWQEEVVHSFSAHRTSLRSIQSTSQRVHELDLSHSSTIGGRSWECLQRLLRQRLTRPTKVSRMQAGPPGAMAAPRCWVGEIR